MLLNKESVQIDREHLSEIINKSYPDLRKCINSIQKYTISGKKANVVNGAESVISTCLSLLEKGKTFNKMRKHIIENRKRIR